MSERLTAYEQSQQAAIQLMQSVQKEQTEIEWLQGLDAQATKDFRTLFDLRRLLWPPENTVEYWTLVTDKMALMYAENKDHPWLRAGLKALLEYLEVIGKEREKRQTGGGNNGSTDDG